MVLEIFPDVQIEVGQGDFSNILKSGGGGLLITVLGIFLLNGGFKAITTRQTTVEDEWGRRHEKRGCSAIWNGFGRLFLGVLCMMGGLGLAESDLLPGNIALVGFLKRSNY